MIARMGSNRDIEQEQGEGAAAEMYEVHWAVFLPTGVIAVLYLGLWFWFTEVHGTSGGMSRVALLVLAVGVPLLVAHAGLRYVNGRLELMEEELIACPGWPVRRERHVAYRHIADVKLRRGLIGRVLDVGSLVIVDRNGDKTVMPDLSAPRDVFDTLSARIDAARVNDVA